VIRVVCPHTSLNAFTKAALDYYVDSPEYSLVYTQHGYYDLLYDLWEFQEWFLIVEHDIEIHDDVIPQMEACPEPWCAFPYAGPTDGTGDPLLYGSLGCTRFSSALLEAEPDFMAALPVRNWKHLDAEIKPRLMTRGYQVHTHWPVVLHHHVRENGRCDCGETH